MKYLFFIIHPAYFHVFRNTINTLLRDGNTVDIIISSKDILEDLVINENWDYTNLFPKGRKIKYLPRYLSAAINTIRTIIKTEIFLIGRKYDLFITDDLLCINGKLHKIPTFYFQDDDVDVVPETKIVHFFPEYIMSPACSNMGKYDYKKVSFNSYKELAYLHPNWFVPDIDIVRKINPNLTKYFIIRLVSLKAVHDVGKNGLTDTDLRRLIDLLENHGKVFITAERELPKEFLKYKLKIKVNDISHILNHAELVISDSQTMTAESAVLGVPNIRFNDFVGKISYLNELERKYKLTIGIPTNKRELLFEKVEELLTTSNLRELWQNRRDELLRGKIDLSSFLIKFINDFSYNNK